MFRSSLLSVVLIGVVLCLSAAAAIHTFQDNQNRTAAAIHAHGTTFRDNQNRTPAAIHTHGTTFRDNQNRTRIFHGINYVSKSGDHIPTITNDEIQHLISVGANVVRLVSKKESLTLLKNLSSLAIYIVLVCFVYYILIYTCFNILHTNN